ncbi:MAG: methyltransferase, partial [Alphaproteobacteria bacterium]|nr:methyltransferase [Alphaproteobacteria bacterium]
ASFDFVFIDADKANNRHYLDWALKLTRRGGVIVCDNVVRAGKVLDAQTTDPAIIGTRDVYDALSGAPNLTSTVIQTVGSKGWDGFAIALVE